MHHSVRSLSIAIAGAVIILSGCVHGPGAFRASHEQHNEALRERIDEQLLLNVVRLRYRDSPLFLQVGSVVTQFQIDGAVGASGSFGGDSSDSVGVDANVGWSEQPTYTFTPLQDDEFVRRLITPIDFDLVMLLQRSGWSIERVIRLIVQNIGGLDNAASASGPTPEKAPTFAEFQRLARVLRELQQQGKLQLGYEEKSVEVSAPVAGSAVLGADLLSAAQSNLRFAEVAGSPSQLVLTRTEASPVLRLEENSGGLPVDGSSLRDFTGSLGLAPGRTIYPIVEGSSARQPAEATSIALATRSLLGTLYYLSHGIDVPADHLRRGLVTVTREADGSEFDWRRLTGDLFRVKNSVDRPASAAVAVAYRNHWFYIEDTDLQSKTTFGLLMGLFNMSAGSADVAAPALTLSVGG